MSGLSIRRASSADVTLVAQILMDASSWLQARGIRQWDFDQLPKVEAVVHKRLREGEVYLASDRDELAGTLTLQWSDPFWGALGQDPHSAYLHSVAILRAQAGRQWGRELIHWAEDYCFEKGRQRLCLDCYSSNQRLVQYYQDFGYSQESSKIWNDRALSFMAKDLR